MNFLDKLGELLVPDFLELRVSEFFEKKGIYKVPYEPIAIYSIATIILALIISIMISVRYFKGVSPIIHLLLIIFFIALFITIGVMLYVGYYDYLNYKRTQEIEKVLPDYLSLVASNLRSGMTVDRALWTAASPRLGVLTTEIRKAAKEVATGMDLSISLTRFAQKYDSIVLNRAIDLILEGLESGGQLADVIDKVVENIEQTVYLRKEMQAASLSYVIFITIIVIIISPFLFALSHNLLLLITNIASKISIPNAGGMGAFSVLSAITNISISPNDFKNFAYIAISIISIFSSMIISIINKDSIMGGIKYIPIFLVMSLISFILFTNLLEMVFKSMIS